MKLSNPKWLKKDMVKSLRDVVKLEYNIKFHSLSMQRLSAGMVYNNSNNKCCKLKGLIMNFTLIIRDRSL